MTYCMADDLRRVSPVPRHSRINQKTRPGFMIRRNVDRANRRNLKSIIVMHRPLLFPESIEIMVMLLVSSGM